MWKKQAILVVTVVPPRAVVMNPKEKEKGRRIREKTMIKERVVERAEKPMQPLEKCSNQRQKQHPHHWFRRFCFAKHRLIFAGDFKSLTNKTNKFCLWSSNLCQIHVGSHCCLCFDALQHVTDAVCCASLFCESCDCTEIRQKPLLCCGVQFGDRPADCEWWLLDSGASYSVLSSEASKHYKIVGSAPFPKGIGDFSAANGGKIIMETICSRWNRCVGSGF